MPTPDITMEDDAVVLFNDLRSHEQVIVFEQLLTRLGYVIVRNPYRHPRVRLEATPGGERAHSSALIPSGADPA